MVLKLDIRPHWVSVNMLIDDDADPKEYKCEKLRLLLNQTVGEGKDIICTLFNVDPRSYQLLTDGSSLPFLPLFYPSLIAFIR